jgi:CRP/FNR family transcriptional regulator, cyclic AMP receptor protein
MTDVVPAALCKQVPIFAGLNESECRQLADIATVQVFKSGELLVRQGEMNRTFWILLEGMCEVIRWPGDGPPKTAGAGSLAWSRTGEPIVLAVLAPFTHFGEMSFFRPAPHSASVRAQTGGRALRIERVDYDDLIRDGVWGAYKLAYNVTQTLADRLRRMDEWIGELMAHRPATECEPEWNKFRERLFGEWNL